MIYIIMWVFMLIWLAIIYSLVFSLGLGLPVWVVMLILVVSLAGSNVNIPLFYIRSWRPIIRGEVVRFLFFDFIVPTIDIEEQKTLIAVNLGGCVIPVLLSIYLAYRMVLMSGFYVILFLIIAIIIDSLAIYSVSRPIQGVGIVTPALLPPLFTLIIVEVLSPFYASVNFFAFIYTVGTLSSLIGADLLNINKIPKLGAPVASIGGAGIFDGIFLNGIIAVLFAL